MKTIGIDLAGKPENSTGFCVLSEMGSQTRLLNTDLQILREVEIAKPDCIGIDAPFWIPRGPWRPSEELLMKKGFRPVSLLLPTMRMLALRAGYLIRILRERKYKVIEVFPRATEKILGLSKEPQKNKDEYDALLAALTAKVYLEGRYEDLGGIIIPK